MFPPTKIVCLTEETVETLYLLGEQDRIVGISGYVVRPPQARREKPRVSAFTSADMPKILALEPDLVLAFSDLQADIVADLIRRGIAVHAFNQRTIAGILDMVRMVGAMVGASERAEQLANGLTARVAEARARSERLPARPRVFFEEWDDPLICGIGWVSELIAVAGGVDIFADQAISAAAKGRIVSAEEVVARQPDLIIGSWCGKRFRPERERARSGFEDIPAVRDDAMFEIKSPLILQPGPAALTDGLAAMQTIIEGWVATTPERWSLGSRGGGASARLIGQKKRTDGALTLRPFCQLCLPNQESTTRA
jgi:iron complex transport system substrate-binding protein